MEPGQCQTGSNRMSRPQVGQTDRLPLPEVAPGRPAVLATGCWACGTTSTRLLGFFPLKLVQIRHLALPLSLCPVPVVWTRIFLRSSLTENARDVGMYLGRHRYVGWESGTAPLPPTPKSVVAESITMTGWKTAHVYCPAAPSSAQRGAQQWRTST